MDEVNEHGRAGWQSNKIGSKEAFSGNLGRSVNKEPVNICSQNLLRSIFNVHDQDDHVVISCRCFVLVFSFLNPTTASVIAETV